MPLSPIQLNEVSSGTYGLVFACSQPHRVSIGKLGIFGIKPGYYVYVGSAFGQGGLKSRINRHLRVDKRSHWHLDYLRPQLTPLEIWYTTDSIKREHSWANCLLNDDFSAIIINNFGSSDCDCSSHLFYYEIKPQFEQFCNKILGIFPNHGKLEKLDLLI